MSPRLRLTLVVLAAAALCARAAPSDNDIVQKPVQRHQVVTLKEGSRANGISRSGGGDIKQDVVLTMTISTRFGKDEATEKDSCSDSSSSSSEVSSELAPPIKRYPHAVLFGGTCGGSIISPKWILTAGHCTLFTAGRVVLAGTDNSANGSGIRRRVKRLIIHPKFSVGPYWLNTEEYNIRQVAARWDFLLVELEDKLPINNVTTAIIPLESDIDTPSCLNVGYAGFGAEKHGETMRPDMHIMDMNTLPDDICTSALEQYDPTDMMCTRGRPPRYDSACNGDSGSGLVGNGKLLGVASWVQDDALECRNKTLVVFSRVAAVREWIQEMTNI